MSKNNSSMLRYLSNYCSCANAKMLKYGTAFMLLLCQTLNLLLQTDGAAVAALQHRGDLPVQRVHCVTHEEFIC